jgi:arabinan endo-1,5-alpha-L-arabinosidase
MTARACILVSMLGVCLAARGQAQPAAQPGGTIKLADIRMRDVCILPDPNSKTYYMIGPGGRGVRQYTSKDLATWEGPRTIYTPARDVWGDIRVNGIWAPELHAYRGKYYLFLTFDTRHPFPEQWRNWRPRVTRGSAILWSDSPAGPFTAFQKRSTPPTDMMTLDGTLWVQDGVPYMVFAHEWVQITIGTIEYLQLKDDLSEAVSEPQRLFDAQDGPWAHKGREGCYVTDAPYLLQSTSGRLFLIWSSFGTGGYTVGVAVSDSGKLAGPWVQRPEPLYARDGGHGMLFRTIAGKLMLILHSPNGPTARPRIFELEDTGETLRIVSEFTGDSQSPSQPK